MTYYQIVYLFVYELEIISYAFNHHFFKICFIKQFLLVFLYFFLNVCFNAVYGDIYVEKWLNTQNGDLKKNNNDDDKDNNTSYSSVKHNNSNSLEEYLKGRWSRSSNFD